MYFQICLGFFFPLPYSFSCFPFLFVFNSPEQIYFMVSKITLTQNCEGSNSGISICLLSLMGLCNFWWWFSVQQGMLWGLDWDSVPPQGFYICFYQVLQGYYHPGNTFFLTEFFNMYKNKTNSKLTPMYVLPSFNNNNQHTANLVSSKYPLAIHLSPLGYFKANPRWHIISLQCILLLKRFLKIIIQN